MAFYSYRHEGLSLGLDSRTAAPFGWFHPSADCMVYCSFDRRAGVTASFAAAAAADIGIAAAVVAAVVAAG